MVSDLALLNACLSEGTAHAAPVASVALKASLAKMALAGVGEAGTAASSGAVSTAGASLLGTLAGKIAAVVAAGVLIVGGIVAYKAATAPPTQQHVKQIPTQPVAQPAHSESSDQSKNELIPAADDMAAANATAGQKQGET